MAYYLSLNGTTDYIKTPSITFNKVIVDGSYDSDANGYYFDSRTGGTAYFFRSGGGDGYSGGTYKWNGTTIPQTATTIPTNTRGTLEIVTTATTTDDVTLFGKNTVATSNDCIKGTAYDIKIYNGATLVAWYDLTLGNVQDQSGNGNHATLTGGTWVSSGTTQNGASSPIGVSTLSATATVIPAAITGSASLQGVGTVSATADVISPALTGSANMTGVGSVTASAGVIRAGSASLMGVSTLTANAAGLNVLGGASLTGVAWLTADAVEGAEHISTVNLMARRELDVSLYASQDITVNLYASI